MKDFRTMSQDIAMLAAELKIRRGMTDDDIARLIGVATGTLRNYRQKGTFANMPFCKVEELAREAGYEVEFTKKEVRK